MRTSVASFGVAVKYGSSCEQNSGVSAEQNPDRSPAAPPAAAVSVPPPPAAPLVVAFCFFFFFPSRVGQHVAIGMATETV